MTATEVIGVTVANGKEIGEEGEAEEVEEEEGVLKTEIMSQMQGRDSVEVRKKILTEKVTSSEKETIGNMTEMTESRERTEMTEEEEAGRGISIKEATGSLVHASNARK